jgi:hypothetical protein
MTFASRCARWTEITLWIAGVTLLGVALGATLFRWHYQTQQERALFADVRIAERQVARAPELRATPGLVESLGPPPPAGFIGPQRPVAATPSTPAVESKPVSPRETAPRTAPAAFGRIEIPRLGLRAIVKEGAD